MENLQGVDHIASASETQQLHVDHHNVFSLKFPVLFQAIWPLEFDLKVDRLFLWPNDAWAVFSEESVQFLQGSLPHVYFSELFRDICPQFVDQTPLKDEKFWGKVYHL